MVVRVVVFSFHGQWKRYLDLDFDPGPSVLSFFEGVGVDFGFLKIKEILENKRVDR